MKKYIPIIICIIILLFTLTGCGTQKQNEENEFTIVSSFYPTYIMLANITDGAEDVKIENMTSNNIGCLHDYTLTTQDLMKLEEADVFVTSGVENFMTKISSTYPELLVINPITEPQNIISDEHGTNNHMWLDISNYILQVKIIAEELAKVDPANEAIYKENMQSYVQELEETMAWAKEEFTTTKKCVSFDETLDYLKFDMNLEIETIQTDHEQNGLSAEKVSSIIEYMKQNNIKNIITSKDSNNQNAITIAAETGAKIYQLDTATSGEMDKNAYIAAMEYNIEQIKTMED